MYEILKVSQKQQNLFITSDHMLKKENRILIASWGGQSAQLPIMI